jgi:predicted nuclease of predicted toxin-antitoxin system
VNFLADMGVDQRIVDWLRAQGHDAVHLREQGLHRLPDADIFAKAIAEQRIILTFDLDFGEILALSAGAVVSVVLFRLNNTRTSFVQQRLAAVIAADASALQRGAVIVVEDGRHRVRGLPIGPGAHSGQDSEKGPS